MKHLIKSALILLALLLPATAMAHDFEVDGIYYNINGNEATVTYQGTSYNQYSGEYWGEVTIPATVTWNGTTYPVTAINKSAFANCTDLTRVTIPNSVTTIGQQAFYQCTGLTSVELPNTVTTIDKYTFYNCSSLSSISIPNSVTTIGQASFYQCTSLTSIEIPNSVITIDQQAFYGCSGISSATIGTSVTNINRNAFYGCTALEVLNYNAVSCNDLAATSPFKTTSISVINIGDGVQRLPKNFARDLTNLTSIEIPKSVNSIGQFIFLNCINLTNVTIASDNPFYDSRDNCNAVIETATNTLISGCNGSFIPNTVSIIGDWAFSYCSGLTSIEIPNSVTAIGESAFYKCSGLTSIRIPNSVNSIGSAVFSACTNITSLSVASDNPYYDSRNNCNAIIETATNTLISGCQNTIIPNSVSIIGEWAFCSCTGLTSIEIPNSVSVIGGGAFDHCTGLTSINIPNTVTTLTYNLFDGCSSLSSIEIPNSVTTIQSAAFHACRSLTSVEIPNSVTTIQSTAFFQCYNLSSIIIPNSVSFIEENALDSTAWMRNQPDGMVYAGLVAYKYKGTIPEGTVIILRDGTLGIAGQAFYFSDGLTGINIPNSVTNINKQAFYNCKYLTSVTLPGSITELGRSAFEYCSSLNDVYSYITDPSDITMGANIFTRSPADYTGRTLHVPVGTLAAYQADANWSPFFSAIVEMISGDVDGDGSVTISDVTTLIDYLLSGNTSTGLGDVDGDGSVTISDVTTLIDMLLSRI